MIKNSTNQDQKNKARMVEIQCLEHNFFVAMNAKMGIEKCETHLHLSYEEKVVDINKLTAKIKEYRKKIKELNSF